MSQRIKTFLTDRRVLVCWTVLLFLSGIVRFLAGLRKGKFSGGDFADLFINYEGGFVRRGLLGEILLQTQQLGVNPLYAGIMLAVSAYVVLIVFFVRGFRKNGGEAFWLFPCYILGGGCIYGLQYIRRDYLIVAMLIFIIWLSKRIGLKTWIAVANVLSCITILCYEPFAFFAMPVLVALTRVRGFSWMKSIGVWILPFVVFCISCICSGSENVFLAVKESTSGFLANTGITNFLGRATADVVVFHLHNNFCSLTGKLIPNVLYIWPCMLCMVYYSVYAPHVFRSQGTGEDLRAVRLLVVFSLFVCSLPMFTVLSTDYARTFSCIALTTYALTLILPSEGIRSLFPKRMVLKAERLLSLTDCHFRPTRFRLVLIMLFVGFSSWTGGGMRDHIRQGEVLNVVQGAYKLVVKAVTPIYSEAQ